jgi:hypothetical protein
MTDVIQATVKAHNKTPGKLEWRVLVSILWDSISAEEVFRQIFIFVRIKLINFYLRKDKWG